MKLRLLLAALLFPALASAQTVVFETLSMTDPSQSYYPYQICCYGINPADGFAYEGPTQELHSLSLWADMYYPGNLKVDFYESVAGTRTLLQSWSAGRRLTPDTWLMFDPGMYLHGGNEYWIRLSMEYTDFFQDIGSAGVWQRNFYPVNQSLAPPWDTKVFMVRVPEPTTLALSLLGLGLLAGTALVRTAFNARGDRKFAMGGVDQ